MTTAFFTVPLTCVTPRTMNIYLLCATKLIPGEESRSTVILSDILSNKHPSPLLEMPKEPSLGKWGLKPLTRLTTIDLNEKAVEKATTEEAIRTLMKIDLPHYSFCFLARKKVKCSPTSWFIPRFERIGDHGSYTQSIWRHFNVKKMSFSEAALLWTGWISIKKPLALSRMLDSVENMILKAQSLIERHKEIKERVLRKTHIKRLNKAKSSTQVNFIDIISHYTSCIWPRYESSWKQHAEQI